MKKTAYYFLFILIFQLFACIGDESSNFEVEVKRLDSIYSVDPQTAIYSDYADEYGYFWEFIPKTLYLFQKRLFQIHYKNFKKKKILLNLSKRSFKFMPILSHMKKNCLELSIITTTLSLTK